MRPREGLEGAVVGSSSTEKLSVGDAVVSVAGRGVGTADGVKSNSTGVTAAPGGSVPVATGEERSVGLGMGVSVGSCWVAQASMRASLDRAKPSQVIITAATEPAPTTSFNNA